MNGFVQIVDRKKDMINRGGENVYCLEVENAIAEHPAVFEVAVVGVPDVMMGEKVGAAVVLREGSSLARQDLTDFLRERILSLGLVSNIESRIVIRSVKHTTAAPLGLISPYVSAQG